MVFAFLGPQVCAALGFAIPADLAAQLQEKKLAILMGSWFLGNTLINSITSTGAFEIMYGSDVVFSKLAVGRMPTLEEIISGIQEAMEANRQ